MEIKRITINQERNVTLTAYIQDVGGEFINIERRPAMLVLPGGGYYMCSDREAEPVALRYLEAGYQAFILRYSVAEHAAWPNPLNDYEQAMELIRKNADEWHLYPDKVAVVGFSAGGHLAAAAATMAKNRPNAALLGYAVAGNDVKISLANAPDTTLEVDQDTCPCFIFASRTDNMVLVRNSMQFMQALLEHEISFESHLYAYGPHGFTVCNSSVKYGDTPMCNRIKNWVDDSLEWLKDVLGDFGEKEMTKPACTNHINGDFEEYLSEECTVGTLMENAASRSLILPLLEKMKCLEDLESGSSYGNLLKKMQLKSMLGFMGGQSEESAVICGKLAEIKNTKR